MAFSDDFGTRCGGGEGGATGRHDYEDSVAKRGALPAAGHQLVAHREGGLHAHHHNRRRHYVEKHVSAKPSQPGRGAQRRRRAAAGRGHDPHGETAKEQRRNTQPSGNPTAWYRIRSRPSTCRISGLHDGRREAGSTLSRPLSGGPIITDLRWPPSTAEGSSPCAGP